LVAELQDELVEDLNPELDGVVDVVWSEFPEEIRLLL